MSVVTLTANDLFDKSIFDLLGIADAPSDRKDAIIATMMETVENRVTARVLDSLPEENAEAFEQAVEQGEESVREYLDNLKINIASLTAEEVIFYKAEITEMVTGKKIDFPQP